MEQYAEKKTVAIIGAGIAGLALAYKLLKKGIDVTVFEKEDYIGGQLASINIDGFSIDSYYHYAFRSDDDLWDLCRELGIYEEVFWIESKVGYYTDHGLYEFGTPKSILGFKPLAFIDRIKFVLSSLKLKYTNDIKYTEKFTAEDWIKKNAGNNVWNTIWEPLFKLKFDELSSEISLTWLWDKIKLRGSSRKSRGLKEELAYMKGSFGLLVKKLEEKILENGGNILTNIRINKIEKDMDEFNLHTENMVFCFDKVISTIASPELEKICDFSSDYADHLLSYKYNAAVCMILVSKEPFSEFFWMNIGDASLPFGAVIEHSNLFGKEHYNNKHIIYISRYLNSDNEIFSRYFDRMIKDLFYTGLKRINPEFSEDQIEVAKIFRNKYAQPIVPIGYKPPGLETEIKGLYWLSAHHTYPHDRGINYAIKLADELSEMI